VRVGVVGVGFVALVAGVVATSIGFAGLPSCSASGGHITLPFGISLALGCYGFDGVVLLGIAALFSGCALILWGALAIEDVFAPETPEDVRRRKSGPLVHSIGLGRSPAGAAPGAGTAPPHPRPRPRAAPRAAPSEADGEKLPFEERACPSCGYSNLLVSSVCARCGKALPELP
jgi:hypothetical protein